MNKQLNRLYDAYFDADTGEWLEKKCSDPACEFCSKRPDLAPEAGRKAVNNIECAKDNI
jgi:hypothetical protein